MLYREIIAVCSEIHTKHVNTMCGQNVEWLNAKPGGTYSDHWDCKMLSTFHFAYWSGNTQNNSFTIQAGPGLEGLSNQTF